MWALKYITIFQKFLKEIDNYKAFKNELKLFLLLQPFYSVEKFVSSQGFANDKH